MYDDILIPTDGSKGTEEAVKHGLDIAEKYGATVHIMYVVDTSDIYLGEGEYQDILQQARNLGRASVGDIADEAEKKGLDVVEEIGSG
ncbi:MAG: universal stress protein, partial [Halobacteria archaeon]|nr:universal stress protein [Halobacteria archaeon]